MLRNQPRTKQIIYFCCHKNAYFACIFCIGNELQKYFWEGPLQVTWPKLSPEAGLLPTLDQISCGFFFIWVLETTKHGDSTSCLGNFFQCCMFLLVKKIFPMTSLNLPSCSCSSTQLPNTSSCCSLFSTCHCQEVLGCIFLQMLFWSLNFSNRMENRNVFDVKHS